MKLYFAYGANLNRDSMSRRCPAAVPVSRFHLHSHRLVFSGVATILPDENSRVPGALWLLTPACEQSLDQFEGWPYLYRKEVMHQEGREFMVYVMNHAVVSPPSVSYFDTIQQGYGDWQLDTGELEAARAHSVWESQLGTFA